MSDNFKSLKSLIHELEKEKNFEQREKLSQNFYNLFLIELDNINQHFLNTHSPYVEDKEIKLYIDDSNKKLEEKHFYIYNNKNQNVGVIKFLGNNAKEKYLYGNVYYFIDSEHRGKGYALKALKLMSNKLYTEGIKELFIAAYTDNYTSIKIIKNFGGKQIKSKQDNISLYKCDLKLICNTKKQVSK